MSAYIIDWQAGFSDGLTLEHLNPNIIQNRGGTNPAGT